MANIDNKICRRTWKDYWENYYALKVAPSQPSLFAEYCLKNYLKEGNLILELGCGNGRDALFFALNSMKVHAIDQCENEIKVLSDNYRLPNLKFEYKDFTNLDDNYGFYDIVYSRFTMHSINVYGEDSVLKWCSHHINKFGYILIEVRGKQNELYGKGVAVENEEDAFIYEEHYRRFIDSEKIKNKLAKYNFDIKFLKETSGFSPFNEKDETFLRIVGKKI